MTNLNIELSNEQAKALESFINDYLDQAGEIVPNKTTGNALFSALMKIEENLTVPENNCLNSELDLLFPQTKLESRKLDVTSLQSGKLKEEIYYNFPIDPTF